MERYNLHAGVLEQRRQKELEQRNLNAKRRLQEIGSRNENTHITDLKNVSKVVESILSSKDLEAEYQTILNNLDIMKVDKLDEKRNIILTAVKNDVYFTRIFSEFTELLGKSVIDAYQKKLLKKGGKNTVKFFD